MLIYTVKLMAKLDIQWMHKQLGECMLKWISTGE